MTSRRCFLLFLSFIGLGSGALATTPLTSLVDNKTPIVFSVHDMPTLLANWAQSPWAKTWNDEQVKKFLAPMRAEMKVDEWDERCKTETGYTVQELLALATGDAIVALKNFDFALQDPVSKDVPLLIAIELGKNSGKVDALITESEKKQTDNNHETEEFSGVTVHIAKTAGKSDGYETTVWAFVDGVGLLSPSKSTVLAAIDAIKRGGVENPLGQDEAFLRARQRTGDSQVIAYVNVQAVYPVLQKITQAKTGGSSGQPNALGFDPAGILPALGVDAVNEAYFTMHMGEEQTEVYFGITYSELRGMMKLMAYGDGPPTQPALIPARAISGTTMKFSIRDAYTALEDTLENLSPVISGIVQGQIKNYNKQLGVDLKRDLIGSLGNDIAVASLLPAGASDATTPALTDVEQLYAISLGNSAAFTSTIETIKHLVFGPDADTTSFNKREYLGSTIYTFAPPAALGQMRASGFSYAITKNHLLLGIGSAAPVEAALQGLAGGQPSFWDKAEVKRALGEIPANASTFQFQDARSMVAAVINTLGKVPVPPQVAAKKSPAEPAQGADEDGDETPAEGRKNSLPFDPSAKPDPEVISKYWSFAYGYAVRESNGIYAKSTVLHPK